MNLYCITFPNGKRYVGIESQGGNRWHAHCNPPSTQRITVVARAIKKYGKNNCKFEYLAKDYDREVCLEWEKDMIRIWNLTNIEFGYNVSLGGIGPLGIKHSEETKKYISENSKTLWSDPEYRARVIENQTGSHVHTDEWKKKMSERCLGVPLTSEHKNSISKSLIGRILSEETCAKISSSKKAVYQADPTLAARCTRNCHTDEANEKNRKSHLGKAATEESKRKVSESLKRAYAEGKRKPVRHKWTEEQKLAISQRLKDVYANGTRKSRKGISRSLSLI